MKKKEKRNFFLLGIPLTCLLGVSVVFWATVLDIGQQTATLTGSNNGSVTFSSDGSHLSQYVNSGDDSTIIGNYFQWYYYDTLYGFFRLDWSTQTSENVRIVDTTSACATWVGYKLWWKAYSQYAGYIDFNHSDDDFVYYCESDGLLHGEAYSQYVWFHRFESIGFEIATAITQAPEVESNTWVFVNDDTTIYDSLQDPTDPSERTSWEFIDTFEDSWESLFYIIK
jgi:hypothetical protein